MSLRHWIVVLASAGLIAAGTHGSAGVRAVVLRIPLDAPPRAQAGGPLHHAGDDRYADIARGTPLSTTRGDDERQ